MTMFSPCGDGAPCFVMFGGEVSHDPNWHLVREARSLVEASPCHCISSGGTHQLPRKVSVCSRCRWLAAENASTRPQLAAAGDGAFWAEG